MKFIIEIDDFWLDQESELEPELKNHIIRAAVNQIWKKAEEKIDKDIIIKIDSMVKNQLYKKAGAFMDEFFATGTIESDVYDRNSGRTVKKEVTIDEYIKSKFLKDSGWNSPNDHITRIAKDFGEELKRRYDLQFAAQIVNKLADNGLLKDDQITKLLEK